MQAFCDRVVLMVARLGPCGLAPRAPGTVGSAAAVLAAPWLFLPLPLAARVPLLAALFVVGAFAAGRAERLLGGKDPSSVVIDELVGQWIVLLPLSLAGPPRPDGAAALAFAPGPLWGGVPVLLLAAGFVLFRLFDIAKPGPVRASENWLPAGWGIMIDDVVAGVMGLTILGLLFALVRVAGL